MLSYWQQSSFQKFDTVVVGGGIVGLSAAIALKEKDSERSVLVVDKGMFPSGASIKNAGFACFGGLSEILDDLNVMSADEVFELVKRRYEGLQLLIHRLGVEALGYYAYGGYDVLDTKRENEIERMAEVNEMLLPIFGKAVFSDGDKYIDRYGFTRKEVKHLVRNEFEGQINTGWMMKSLIQFAGSLGVFILTNTEVEKIDEQKAGVELLLKNTDQKLKADSVAICTNAWSKKLLPNLDLKPGRGLVLITKKIEELSLRGSFHMDGGYYYFRNVGKRVLFGGGRNLDKENEETTEEGVNTLIKEHLLKLLRETVLPKHTFEVDHFWSGIMAFGNKKTPICSSYSDRIFVAARLGGMGVALGSKLGTDLADLILDYQN